MMETILLRNQVPMPLQGFGVFQITDSALCEQAVTQALQAGYRLIDTAACYGNERAVGKAVAESGISREDLFLVSKVWIQDAGYEQTKRSFSKTLDNLGTDYLDLYLIHMPYGDYHGSWRAMEELYEQGHIRAIGVCNFLPDRLTDLILTHRIAPMVNQMEIHPFCQQTELCALMAQYQIQPMAWAPFAEGQNQIFTHPLLTQMGQAYGKTPAQVVLRWLLQNQIVAIPKSVHEDRIRENFSIDDFVLSQEDMEQIQKMDLGHSVILNITSLDEVHRLHGIRFEQ